jgi:RNA polymerase sigma factor (sigma-70 family)
MGADSRLRGFAGPLVLAGEPDERLVALARAGDERAFAAIVERYRAPLLRYVLGYLPPATAEDALQQAFINAHAALTSETTRVPVSLRPWLYRVAHNAALNVRRDPQASFAPLPDGLDGVERPEDALQRSERLWTVVRALRALPDRQREVIVRHALDGDSHEQIAADLGVSTGAIRQLAHRARRTVREAAAAVLPVPLLRWLPWGSALAESPAAGGGGAKVAAVVVATAVAGGGAVEVVRHDHRPAAIRDTAGRVAPPHGHRAEQPRTPVAVAPVRTMTPPTVVVRRDPSGRGSGSSGSGSSGSGTSGSGSSGSASGTSGGSGSSGSSSSGSGGGTSGSSGSSGSGSSGSGLSGSGSSGSGSSSSGSTGSGSSGSGSSGSGTSGSGTSGSGSGTSGSGSSGSGSSGGDSSGSGSSGSGSSGSGTSGSGTTAIAAPEPTPLPTSSGSGSSGSSGSGSSGSG